MTKENFKTILINDKEYTEEDLSNEQKVLINHITVLDNKINTAQFDLEELQVSRQGFISLLETSLNEGD